MVLEGIKLGDSIAVNGICLTTIRFDNKQFTVQVMKETLGNFVSLFEYWNVSQS